MPSHKRFNAPEINTSSMADIAFLLLIFFLVTTEIVEDRGIVARLPPYETPAPQSIPPSYLFSVLINGNDELLVRREPVDISALRAAAKAFISNPNDRPDFAPTPRSAIISLRNDRGTRYSSYLAVYNELLGAYNELWEEEAQTRFGAAYEALTPSQRGSIRERIPLVLSEAEPTDFGGGL